MAIPPCSECRVEILPENEPPMAVYDRLADEWLVGPGGDLIGLPSQNIESAMRICRIRHSERKAVFDDVKLISRVIAREIHEERERKADAKPQN